MGSNYKVYYLILGLLLVFALKGQASWGFKTEYQRGQVNFTNSVAQNISVNIGYGLVFKALQTERVGLQVELHHIKKGYEMKFIDSSGVFEYLELPLYFHFVFLSRPKFNFFGNIGSFLGLTLNIKTTNASGTRTIPHHNGVYNLWQYGIMGNGGVNLKTKFGEFQVGIGFYLHWSNLENAKFDEIQRSTIPAGFSAELIYFLPKFKKKE